MAASSISILALLLLMSAVTPGLSTEGEGSQDHTSTAIIIAMREVSRALECFGDAVQEGLRQQRQSSDALTDLHTLTATVLRVEERINQQGEMIESLKEKNEDLTKVLDLGRNLDESRRYAEKLELLVQQLNNTIKSKKKDVPGCAEQPPQKIKNLVLQYSGSRDWPTLWRSLDAVMDHSSEAYGELKNMDQYSGNPQYDIGYKGYTHVAMLLLCAGMPVDLPDKANYTLLIGATHGGHYLLVKMLLSRGANVNARNIYGFTPLMGAAINGYLETVKLLVQAGTDTTATDVNGSNALYWAKSRGHTAVQQYLEQFPA